MMTQPAKLSPAINIAAVLRAQLWTLLALTALGALADMALAHTLTDAQTRNLPPTATAQTWRYAKNLLAGGGVAWLGQWIFAKIAWRHTGARLRKQIVHRLYLAQMVKWLVTLLGFAVVFSQLRPLAALWVLVGFIVLQINYLRLSHTKVLPR